MSKMGKIGFLVAALCFIVVTAIRFILGVWIPFLYIPLVLAVISLLVSVVSDRKLYVEFFTLRTTKHGMNMGVLILLVFALIVCVNYVSIRHNKTWDLTIEKINSLSDQTLKILSTLDGEAEFKVFYKGADASEDRQRVRQALSVFQEQGSKVKVRYIDSYSENALAQEYLGALADKDQEAVFVFVDYKGKRIRVDAPFAEEQITSALVKVSRRGEKKVYFVVGHGERDLNDSNQQGLSAFKEELTQSSYAFEEINLTEKSQLPTDAALVAVIGPKAPLLENEIALLKQYIKAGGHILLAGDPGERHNLAVLARWMGVDFKNNFVINLDPLTRQASGTSLGVEFDPANVITQALPKGKTLTLFDLASALAEDSGKPKDVQITNLVQTSPMSFVLTEIKSQVAPPKEQKPYTVMMAVNGKIGEGDPEFSAVIVGDSDYLTNRLFLVGSNRDLAMNGLAALTDQNDLISIRPKQMGSNKIMLTTYNRLGMISAGISLPIALLLLSGLLWFKRRGA